MMFSPPMLDQTLLWTIPALLSVTKPVQRYPLSQHGQLLVYPQVRLYSVSQRTDTRLSFQRVVYCHPALRRTSPMHFRLSTPVQSMLRISGIHPEVWISVAIIQGLRGCIRIGAWLMMATWAQMGLQWAVLDICLIIVVRRWAGLVFFPSWILSHCVSFSPMYTTNRIKHWFRTIMFSPLLSKCVLLLIFRFDFWLLTHPFRANLSKTWVWEVSQCGKPEEIWTTRYLTLSVCLISLQQIVLSLTGKFSFRVGDG